MTPWNHFLLRMNPICNSFRAQENKSTFYVMVNILIFIAVISAEIMSVFSRCLDSDIIKIKSPHFLWAFSKISKY